MKKFFVKWMQKVKLNFGLEWVFSLGIYFVVWFFGSLAIEQHKVRYFMAVLAMMTLLLGIWRYLRVSKELQKDSKQIFQFKKEAEGYSAIAALSILAIFGCLGYEVDRGFLGDQYDDASSYLDSYCQKIKITSGCKQLIGARIELYNAVTKHDESATRYYLSELLRQLDAMPSSGVNAEAWAKAHQSFRNMDMLDSEMVRVLQLALQSWTMLFVVFSVARKFAIARYEACTHKSVVK